MLLSCSHVHHFEKVTPDISSYTIAHNRMQSSLFHVQEVRRLTLAKEEQTPQQQPIDAIIVPGVPFKNGKWDQIMKGRVLWSWILYKNGLVKNIIYSGAAVYSPFYEAIIMGLYGQQLGIPAEHMFYDTLAQHSTENVYYSYLLAKKHGFKSIALATDPFQSMMLQGFTKRRFATAIQFLPFNTDSLKVYNYLNPNIDPGPAEAINWVSIYKRQGFTERFKGTLGKHIDFKPYKNGQVDSL